MDVLLGRACNECVSAVAGYSSLVVVRMDSFSHVIHLSAFDAENSSYDTLGEATGVIAKAFNAR